MDYEKLYKETLERAKGIMRGECEITFVYSPTLFDYLFPELAESEDERIRKELSEFLEDLSKLGKNTNFDKWSKADCANWINWLEKQCEHAELSQSEMTKTSDQDSSRPNGGIVLEDFNGGEGFYKLNLDYLNKKQVEEVEELVRMWNKESKTSNEDIKNCIGMCLTDACEQRFKDFNTNLKDCLNWLEKQGDDSYLQEKIESFTNAHKGEDPEGIIAACRGGEEQGEHKPVNEPKFKVGDWITDGEKVWKIGYIEDDMYIEHRGTISGGGAIESIDKHYHLWSIEDAKDGDVLVYGDNPNNNHVEIIMLFKSMRNAASAFNHFHIFDDVFRVNSWCDCGRNAHPATKEQRDLLFSKMKDAGYEWDAEKKDLKKISQRMISAEAKEALYDNVEDFEDELTNILFINTNSSELPVERLMGLCHTIYKDVLEAARKEIEKNPTLIPKFKVGDTIRLKNSLAEFTIESISNGRYYVKGSSIDIIACDHDYELAVPNLANSAQTCKDEKEIRGNNGVIFPKDLIEEQAKFHELFKDDAQLKQDWSEENKKIIIGNIRHIIREYDKITKKANEPCWYIGDCLLWLQDIELKELSQSKQEWSEEDKKKLNRIYQLIAKAADEHAFFTTCRLIGDKECVELQDFLKSLKPQPKQEWSEEDEFCLNTILNILEQIKGQSSYEEDDTAEKCINFLKSKLKK